MADVKWIKITTDIFDDEKVLLIESLPDADAIIVIWFKLLCLAGKMNNSGVFLLNNSIPYTDQMLSTIFRRKETTVKLALQTFEQFGMVKLIDGVVTIPNWGKHQSLERIEERRKYQREYQREYREKQKSLAISDNKDLHKHLHKQNVNAPDKNKKENKKESIEEEDIYIITTEILAELNCLANTKFSSTAKTEEYIAKIIESGHSKNDILTVIKNACTQWRGTDKQSLLRPYFLFGEHFEELLAGDISAPVSKQKQTAAHSYDARGSTNYDGVFATLADLEGDT